MNQNMERQIKSISDAEDIVLCKRQQISMNDWKGYSKKENYYNQSTYYSNLQK
jgi:hypothetical protein